MFMWIIYFVSCLILIGVDQITKYLALVRLKPIENCTVIPGVLDFTFVENRGAAFGILHGQRWFFVVLTVAVAIGIVIAVFKMPKNRQYHMVRFSLAFILSGAVGNLIDRLVRGYVVDFLEITFISWPVFNIADIYVVFGTFLLAFLILFVLKDEPKEKDKKEQD